MKELKIKEYSLMEDGDKHVTTKFFVLQVIKTPVEGGLSIDDVLNRTKLQNVINDAVDTITFEDADFKNFLDLFNKSKWVIFHDDLADFINEVKKLV